MDLDTEFGDIFYRAEIYNSAGTLNLSFLALEDMLNIPVRSYAYKTPGISKETTLERVAF